MEEYFEKIYLDLETFNEYLFYVRILKNDLILQIQLRIKNHELKDLTKIFEVWLGRMRIDMSKHLNKRDIIIVEDQIRQWGIGLENIQDSKDYRKRYQELRINISNH